MKVVRLSALRTGRFNHPPAGNIPGTHFRYRLSQPQGHSAAGRIMSMKNSNDTIGNRIRDFPVCRAVPQPTAPRRAPTIVVWEGGSNWKRSREFNSCSYRSHITLVHGLHGVLPVTQTLMMWTGHLRNVNMRSLHVNGRLHEDKVTAVVQDMKPCTLAGIYEGLILLRHSSNTTTEALGSFETTLTFYQTTRHHIPEGSNVHSQCRENTERFHFI